MGIYLRKSCVLPVRGFLFFSLSLDPSFSRQLVSFFSLCFCCSRSSGVLCTPNIDLISSLLNSMSLSLFYWVHLDSFCRDLFSLLLFSFATLIFTRSILLFNEIDTHVNRITVLLAKIMILLVNWIKVINMKYNYDSQRYSTIGVTR